MDEQTQGKKQRKFNIVDILILVLILGAAAFFVFRYAILPGSPEDKARKVYPFTMTLDNVELVDDNFNNGKIKVGDELIDKNTMASLGKITNIEVKPSRTLGQTSEGQWVEAPRPGSSWVILTVTGEGFHPSAGGINVSGIHIYQNMAYNYFVRDSNYWFRVVDFTIEEP